MAKGKNSSSQKGDNDNRQNKKAFKTRPGVAPGAHNGHSIGGYSIKKYGAERAAELAELKTRPSDTRRAARHALRRKKAAA